jgi:hypothetical protein
MLVHCLNGLLLLSDVALLCLDRWRLLLLEGILLLIAFLLAACYLSES